MSVPIIRLKRPRSGTVAVPPSVRNRRVAAEAGSVAEMFRKEGDTKPAPIAEPPAAPSVQGKDPEVERRAREWAVSTFPVLQSEPVPLRISTGYNLFTLRPRDAGVSVLGVKRFLASWTSQRAYHEAVAAEGSQRYDLERNATGPVSQDHRAHAREVLGAG